MKKFHMKITIEQKESWIISRIDDEPDGGFSKVLETDEAAFANHERNVQLRDHRPERLDQNFSDRLIGWIRRFQLNRKQEVSKNTVQKKEEKYVQK